MNVINNAIELINASIGFQLMPRIYIKDIIEIAILSLLIYYLAKNTRGTRFWVLAKGIMIVLAIYTFAYVCSLNVIVDIFQRIFMFVIIAFIIAMQPEIRKFLENLGRKSLDINFKQIIKKIIKGRVNSTEIKQVISDKTVQELVKGSFKMGKVKTGALIVIEKEIPLNSFVESGISLDAEISSPLLINIFEKNTPLHDGAVIIQNDRITSATCYLPLTDNPNIDKDLGTRHRAAIGLTEQTDALVIVVSEETGAVSVSLNGNIFHNISREELTEKLTEFQSKHEVEIKRKIYNSFNTNVGIRITSLIMGILLWMIVIKTINPVTTREFTNVPIELINTNTIENLGKTYEVLSQSSVNVKITDEKDIVDSINKNDIKVVADFSKLSYTNSINLETTIMGFPNADYSLDYDTMQISIEDIASTEISVTPNIVGEVNSSYYISNIELSSDTVIVTGAASVISTLGKVNLDIEAADIANNTTLTLIPKIYDRNGNIIDNSKLQLNETTIDVTISLYGTKVIPVNIETNINSELDNIIESISYDNDSIEVAGPDGILNEFDSIDIKLDLDINSDDIIGNQFIKNVAIQSYLPNDIMITSEYSSINVIINFKDYYASVLRLFPSNIELMGDKAEKTRITNLEGFIRIIGVEPEIENLTVADLGPYIDTTNLNTGEQVVTIKFKNPKYTESIECNATVSVSE